MDYKMAVIKHSQGTIVTLPPQVWRNLFATRSATPAVWKQVSARITKRTQRYDRAVELLVDLRDAAADANCTDEFSERLQALRDRHASKPGLLHRLQQSGVA